MGDKIYINDGHSLSLSNGGSARIIEPNGKPLPDNIMSTIPKKRLDALIESGTLTTREPGIEKKRGSSAGNLSKIQVPSRETPGEATKEEDK